MWLVGRGDGGCYVEEVDDRERTDLGESEFDTEIEAVRWAIICDIDMRDPLTRNIHHMRKRLRRLEKKR